MSPFRFPAAAIAVFALSGCELFELNIEVPEICQDIGVVEVEGMPGVSDGEIVRGFEVDLAGALEKAKIKLDANGGALGLTRLSLWPAEGLADFGFADEAALSIESADGSLPRMVVARHTRGEAAPTRIEAAPDESVDLLPYAQAGKVRVEASFLGDPPDGRWTLGGEICARVKARYSLF